MVSLKQLQYLVAIADHLHFRRAAERSNVSQPTLSTQLRDLEIRLGAQLVERGNARVLLTPIGKEIAGRARKILREVLEITEIAKHGAASLEGTFRLGVLPTLGPYALPHFLPALHRDYPKLRLYVREGLSDALVHQLEEGRLDFLLVPLPLRRAEIETVRLFREPLLVVAPQEHHIAAKKTVRREDLRGETVLALERGHLLHDQVHDLCETYHAKMSLDFDGTSLDTLRHMVSMNLGISFLPLLYVLSEIHDDSVAARPFDRNPPNRMVGLAWRQRSPHRHDYRELADFIRQTLAEVPGLITLR